MVAGMGPRRWPRGAWPSSRRVSLLVCRRSGGVGARVGKAKWSGRGASGGGEVEVRVRGTRRWRTGRRAPTPSGRGWPCRSWARHACCGLWRWGRCDYPGPCTVCTAHPCESGTGERTAQDPAEGTEGRQVSGRMGPAREPKGGRILGLGMTRAPEDADATADDRQRRGDVCLRNGLPASWSVTHGP